MLFKQAHARADRRLSDVQAICSFDEASGGNNLHEGSGKFDVHSSSNIINAEKRQLYSFACSISQWDALRALRLNQCGQEDVVLKFTLTNVAVNAPTLADEAGSIAGAAWGKWLGECRACYLQTQIDHGNLPLWVRTKDAKAEEQALHILRNHSTRDTHVNPLVSEAAHVAAEATIQPTPERSNIEGHWNV